MILYHSTATVKPGKGYFFIQSGWFLADHSLIRRKVEDNECVICLERTEYPTIVNCCYNVYCAKCILKNTLLSQKCATCRDILDFNNLCCLKPLTDSEMIMTKNKAETCLDLIRENPQGKFIIHSSFENIYYQLFEV